MPPCTALPFAPFAPFAAAIYAGSLCPRREARKFVCVDEGLFDRKILFWSHEKENEKNRRSQKREKQLSRPSRRTRR